MVTNHDFKDGKKRSFYVFICGPIFFKILSICIIFLALYFKRQRLGRSLCKSIKNKSMQGSSRYLHVCSESCKTFLHMAFAFEGLHRCAHTHTCILLLLVWQVYDDKLCH